MKDILSTSKRFGPYLWLIPAVLFLYANQLKFWTDSELWPVVASRYFFGNDPVYFFGIKPFFHFLLWCNFKLSSWSGILHPILLARWFWGLLALFVLVISDQILKHYKTQWKLRVLFQVSMWSCSTWVYRSGEVRSDILVTAIFLMTWLAVEKSNRFKIFYFIFGIISSLLVTLKGLFWWPLALPIFWGLLGNQYKKLSFLAFMLPLLMWAQFKESIYFVQNTLPSSLEDRFFRLEHWIRFAIQNPHLLLGLIFTLFLAVKKIRFNHPILVSLFLFLSFGMFYWDPLPFFIVALLPIIFLLTILIFNLIEGFSISNTYFAAVVLVCVLISAFRFASLVEHNSRHQINVVKWLQGYFAGLPLLVYDPGGILPTGNTEYWFLGPGMGKYVQSTNQYILDQNVDVILLSQKAMYMDFFFERTPKSNYVLYGQSIYVRALDLRKVIGLKTCDEKLKLVRSYFKRQIDLKGPLYIRESDDRIDRTYEIFEIDEKFCRFKINASAAGRAVLIPVALEHIPADDFSALFGYDTNF